MKEAVLQTTQALRKKYAKRRTRAGHLHHAPGGEDVLRLCDLCDRLVEIVREAKRDLSGSQKEEIEWKLWSADAYD